MRMQLPASILVHSQHAGYQHSRNQFDALRCFTTVHPRIRQFETFPDYLRQGGYVIVVLCLFVCLISNFAQKLPNGFARNFQECWQLSNEQNIMAALRSRYGHYIFALWFLLLLLLLPNIGGTLCSTPQSLADAHY